MMSLGSSVKVGHVQSSSEYNLVRDLAFAISECDKILLINDENKGKFCTDIDSAISDKSCFAVRPHSNIVAMDFDEPGDLEVTFLEITDYIKDLGGRPVVVSSGTKGHRHLFCRIENENIHTEIRDFISSRGVSRWLRVNTFIRPPLSPHRSGLKVDLIEPALEAEALSNLSKQLGKKGLPEDAIIKIKHGQSGPVKYRSGSELVQAIVNHCYNSGYTLEETYETLSDTSNRGGLSLQKRIKSRGQVNARNWLKLSYDKAARFITAGNAIDLHKWASAQLKAISSMDIHSKRKISLMKVFKAHVDVASRARSYKYTASVRQIAVISAVSSIVTVSKCNRQLESLNILKRVNKGVKKKASCWEIACCDSRPDDTLCSPKYSLSDTLGSLLGSGNYQGGCGYDVSSGIHFDHDVFRYSFDRQAGMGASAAVVLGCLQDSEGLRIAQICRLTGFCRSTVGRALSKLARGHLVDREGFLWRSASGNLDERLDALAEKSGLLGARARQGDRYQSEREIYLSRYSLR